MHAKLGEMISKRRREMKLSQPQLAELIKKETGVSVKYKAVSSWERGVSEPSVTVFLAICKILNIVNIYETYWQTNPNDLLSGFNDEGKELVKNYIHILHTSKLYEEQKCKIIPITRTIDIFVNAVSAGTGNILEDVPKETITIDNSSNVPENASFGVRIRGNSMEPEFHDNEIAWILQQDTLEDGEIGIFSLNGEAYIKKLQDNIIL